MKRVTFYLGPAVSLTSRRLTITRARVAGDDNAPSALISSTLSGNAESSSQLLPNGFMWEAKLVDTRDTGEVGEPMLLRFTTNELTFPGKACSDERSLFRILHMEDISSSSSSSSQSSSSSESSSSQSSSSDSSSSQSSSSSSSASSESSSSSSSA